VAQSFTEKYYWRAKLRVGMIDEKSVPTGIPWFKLRLKRKKTVLIKAMFSFVLAVRCNLYNSPSQCSGNTTINDMSLLKPQRIISGNAPLYMQTLVIVITFTNDYAMHLFNHTLIRFISLIILQTRFLPDVMSAYASGAFYRLIYTHHGTSAAAERRWINRPEFRNNSLIATVKSPERHVHRIPPPVPPRLNKTKATRTSPPLTYIDSRVNRSITDQIRNHGFTSNRAGQHLCSNFNSCLKLKRFFSPV
jgi:hypothetical protein